MDIKQMYQEKLTTADEAVKIIKSGDWLDYGWAATNVDALDKALAKHMPELTDVNIRSGIILREPAVFGIENPA